MKDAGTRRMTLLDGMALVAAVAVGLAVPLGFGRFQLYRGVNVTIFGSDDRFLSNAEYGAVHVTDSTREVAYPPGGKWQRVRWSRRLALWSAPCLAALSVAALGLGFRRGGAPLDALPKGRATGMAVGLAIVAAAVHSPGLLILNHRPTAVLAFEWRGWWLNLWSTLPPLAGFAVAVSWAALAVCGRWRGVGDWADRLGVRLGAAWIGLALLDLAASWYAALAA